MRTFDARPPDRTTRFLTELEQCAITAEALSRRLQELEGLKPEQRLHAESVARAAYAMCLAAVAVHGCSTPTLRDAFGRYLGATSVQQGAEVPWIARADD